MFGVTEDPYNRFKSGFQQSLSFKLRTNACIAYLSEATCKNAIGHWQNSMIAMGLNYWSDLRGE